MIISYLKNLGISLLILLGGTFLITILNYFNIINPLFTNILNIIIPIVSLFIGGLLIGRESNNKGYLEGIKFGSIYALFIILYNILMVNSKFNFKIILLCIILIISAMIGSMIGINKKEVDK